ncbi:MAG: 3-phosphoserine/phosphohydroxythreonine transaminase [Methanomassiliicoccales archaeon]|nr:MAG: 3-phosphoserine/phosphohydroxythreonine transaminase [Methanomassiliicoccales archaeon]
MEKRVYNFNPGPATLPLPALRKAQAELLDYEGTGISILETSHRSKEFDTVINEASALLRRIYGVPDDYKILWLQGGASTQFYMIPMNIMLPGKGADYINTGTWSKKAIKEAKLLGDVNVAATSEDKNFSYIPKEIGLNPEASYVHITSNNTIFGTQWQEYPETGDVPLVTDMSSDIMSRKLDVKKFGLIYAGAQKNMGPSGVTAVIIREDLVGRAKEDVPTMVKYKTHADKNSMFNTPPCFPIYLCKLVLEWISENGGVSGNETRNMGKADMLYKVIDDSGGFFRGHAEKDSRSIMNVTFRLPSEELEAKCIKEALEHDLFGLKGHRSVGGMRASIYNSMPIEGVAKLSEFLAEFKENNG